MSLKLTLLEVFDGKVTETMSENDRGDEITGEELEFRKGVLENENRRLKNQLETGQFCGKCAQLRQKSDYLTEKCKQLIGKASLLSEYKREISNLRGKIDNLEAQITEKNLICNNLHVENKPKFTRDVIGSPNSSATAGDQSPRVEAGNSDPREELQDTSLYDKCQVVFDEGLRTGREEEDCSDSKDAEDDSEDCGEERQTAICKWVLHGDQGNVCGKVCASTAELASHFNEHHVGVPGPDGYVCSWESCKRNGSPLKRRAWFEAHFRLHSREKPFACAHEGCAKRFGDKSSRREHRYTHEPQRFPCLDPACGRVYQSRRVMMQHYREKHERRRDFACPVAGCGKKWGTGFKMRRHMKVHGP